MSYDNPFEEHNDNPSNPYVGGYVPPPVSSPTLGPSPNRPASNYTPQLNTYSQPVGAGPGDSYSSDAIRRKEEELSRRERELDARERALITRERSNKDPRQPNWPRWPKSLVYQDINKDIDGAAEQKIVTHAFIGWHALCFILLWNLVAMTGTLAVMNAIGDFILAIVYFIIWLPIAFLNYRLLYNGFRKLSGFKFFFYFFFHGFECLVYIFWGLGLHGSGMAGFLWMITLFDDKSSKGAQIVGIFCLIGTALWWLFAAFNIYCWIRVRVLYKQKNLDQQLQQQAARSAGKQLAEHPEYAYEAGKAAATI